MIAERKVSTLILVNRAELVRQWQTRLQTLIVSGAEVGVWYGTKRKRTEEIDIASIQTVERMGEEELRQFLSSYGMLIVDECHHVASPNYQRVVSYSAAKYRYGLSATLVRKDGKEKIINFLCGPELIRVEENLPPSAVIVFWSLTESFIRLQRKQPMLSSPRCLLITKNDQGMS